MTRASGTVQPARLDLMLSFYLLDRLQRWHLSTDCRWSQVRRRPSSPKASRQPQGRRTSSVLNASCSPLVSLGRAGADGGRFFRRQVDIIASSPRSDFLIAEFFDLAASTPCCNVHRQSNESNGIAVALLASVTVGEGAARAPPRAFPCQIPGSRDI
jgi:hypothetical protein